MATLLDRLHQWADEAPQDPAQAFQKNGNWEFITTQEYRDRVFYLGLFLESKGFRAGDIVAVFSYNCPEYVHLDLAPHLIGGKTVGIYPNTSEADLKYVLDLTEAKVIGVQNKDYFKKMGKLPSTVQIVISFDDDESFSPLAVSYTRAIQEGKKLSQGKVFKDYLKKLDENAGAFLIFTSGTTGHPKGAMISHDNICFATDQAIEVWQIPVGQQGRIFSFLPLCHIAEKLQNLGCGITGRYVVYFCSKFENLTRELPIVKPTILLCVPRVWEKMMEGVSAKLKDEKGPQKVLADWAFSIGAKRAQQKWSGRGVGLALSAQYLLAHALVLSKVKEKLGMSDILKCASGAAALPAHVTQWFRILDLEILEDFGQTESTGITCMTMPGVDCAGTVGKPAPGLEFKIAEDGEILTRGRHVFKGYFKNEQATHDTVVEGWLHTGDLGEITPQGLVRIRGRKKEIMKTSGGKMIAPAPIEEKIKVCEIISQVCLVGDGRKFFAALITLSEPTLKEIQKTGGVPGEVIEFPHIIDQVKGHLNQVNAALAGFERIKNFTVLAREFSIEEGEMTPTLKIKRNVIEQRFRHLIDRMYQGGGD